VWFSQNDIPLLGPFGITLGPDGELYFDADPADGYGAMVVYRLPLVDHPTSADLQEVHSFAPQCCQTNLPQGLAFDRAGRLYVSGLASGEISILKPDGGEQARIASPEFDAVNGLAFLGTSLLAANSDFNVVEDPSHWTISRVQIANPAYRPSNQRSPSRRPSPRA
jgi:sugar lactone lactonase YvrE